MKGQKPDFEVYTVDDSRKKTETDKALWVRVGSGWTNKASISIVLAALPVNGRLVLLLPKPKPAYTPKKPTEKMDVFGS